MVITPRGRRIAALSAAAVLAIPVATAGAAPSISSVVIGPPANAYFSLRLADTGVVSGTSFGFTGDQLNIATFRYAGGRLATLKLPDGTSDFQPQAGDRAGALAAGRFVFPLTTDVGRLLAGTRAGDDIVAINLRGQAVAREADGAAALIENGRRTPINEPSGARATGVIGGLNESGQVLGTALDATGSVGSGFLWKGGRSVDLGKPKIPGVPASGVSVSATLLNERADVAGFAFTETGPSGFTLRRFFRSAAGRFTVLTGFGADPGTEVADPDIALNELGHVAGSAQTASGVQHAYLWTGSADGRGRDLGSLGTTSKAIDVNDLDQVAGRYEAGGNLRAFVWSKGRMTDLPLPASIPAAFGASALAINNLGQILGEVYAPDGSHVVRWTFRD